jgi:hypothetical protein
MKLRHKETGEEFNERDWTRNDPEVEVWDAHGELRLFKREVLEPVPVKEEWENVPDKHIHIYASILHAVTRSGMKAYPHPDLRFHEINGVTVLQRRKA